MKHKIQNKKWSPVTIEITFETKEEMRLFTQTHRFSEITYHLYYDMEKALEDENQN